MKREHTIPRNGVGSAIGYQELRLALDARIVLKGLADDRDATAAKNNVLLSFAAAVQTPSHGELTSSRAHVKELLKRADNLAAHRG